MNKGMKDISTRCDELNNMISTARKKLMKDEIDAIDFRILKQECEKELRVLESKLISSQ
jgi:site-specific DNA recombinase